MELSRFLYVYWPRYFFSFYPPCVPWTLFTHWILHCFLTDHELFVNQRQWAPFLSCIVQICLPIVLLTFDYVSGLFALRKCYSVLQSGLSIHLWFLDILVALELSLSLSAGRNYCSGLLGNSVTGCIPLLPSTPPCGDAAPSEASGEGCCLPLYGRLQEATHFASAQTAASFKELHILNVPNPPTQFTSPCLQPRCHLN